MKRIYVKNEDGSEVEITEGVQVMYDLLHGSMDWGSGFISLEEAIPIANLAKDCGFEAWEEAEAYVAWAQKDHDERKAFRERMAQR